MTVTAARCACGQPARDTTICRECRRELELALITAVLTEPDLNVAIARLARFADPGRRGSGSVLPYDQRASDAAAELLGVLGAWWARVGDPLTDRPLATISSLASWLLRHGGQLAAHPHAGDAHREILAAVANARRAIDRPPGRSYAGPCEQCGTDLLARAGMRSAVCRSCGTVHDVAERQEWLRAQLEDHLGAASYAAMIATALGLRVSAGTVRVWASRRKLTVRHFAAARSEGGTPIPLYRVGDVLDLALARDTARTA